MEFKNKTLSLWIKLDLPWWFGKMQITPGNNTAIMKSGRAGKRMRLFWSCLVNKLFVPQCICNILVEFSGEYGHYFQVYLFVFNFVFSCFLPRADKSGCHSRRYHGLWICVGGLPWNRCCHPHSQLGWCLVQSPRAPHLLCQRNRWGLERSKGEVETSINS